MHSNLNLFHGGLSLAKQSAMLNFTQECSMRQKRIKPRFLSILAKLTQELRHENYSYHQGTRATSPGQIHGGLAACNGEQGGDGVHGLRVR